MTKPLPLIAVAVVSLICDSAIARPRCGFPALSPVCLGPIGAPRPPSPALPTSGATQTTAKPTTKYIFKTFDVPGAGTGFLQGTVPTGILPDGTIAGGVSDSNDVYHAFVRAPNGNITTFDGPAPYAGTGFHQGTVAEGMNAQGAITGGVVDANSTYHAFLRSPDGTFTVFDAPGAGTGTGDPDALLGTHGWSINNKGEISGNYKDANNVWHAYLRAPNGDITTIDAPGAGNSPGQGTFYDYVNFQFFYALNSAGTYTSGYVDENNVSHGFV
jgi:hypothetical protein